MSEKLLDNFLSIATNELDNSGLKRHLSESDIFNTEDDSLPVTTRKIKNVVGSKPSSVVHTGDTDSSDDEYNKYYEDRKYNECGKDIKHLLVSSSPSFTSASTSKSSVTWKNKPSGQKPELQSKKCAAVDVYTDPIFGLRIVNPLVSFTTLKEKMVGRESVTFSRIKTFIARNISDSNWVIGGVIVSKSPVKTSQKGNQFMIWTLSDLKDDIKTVSVFLFGTAYKDLWKTTVGTIVGILNPSILDKKEASKDEAVLSVDKAQKVMILGQSKDLGTCRSIKKNGEPCTAIVNVNRCEYCVYHIKQEYQKCSKRSELQSNFVGKGLMALRNKVLGKNEVFYAGKLYTAIPAKRSKKMEQKDQNRLHALNGVNKNERKTPQIRAALKAPNLEVTHQQRLRDLTLLEKLGGIDTKKSFSASHSREVNLEDVKKNAVDVITKLKTNNANTLNQNSEIIPKTPTQSECIKNLPIAEAPSLLKDRKRIIDLGEKITSTQMHRAKLNALKYVEKNGLLKKADPNSVKKPPPSNKRSIESTENQENPPKRHKIVENEFLSSRFKKIMQATSKHPDLLDERDKEEQEKYFYKLEVKEKMEEKMINTYKVPCKAVQCTTCKYTNFSASQFCKDNKHPLRVFDATKRFFKCGSCGNRTVSLDILPTKSCKNCGLCKWERTGMMKERIAEVAHKLSIRGGEQTFINSVLMDANLDLLVPDDS